MEVNFKDILTWAGGVLAIGLSWGTMRATVSSQNKRIKKLETVMTSDEDGGAPFVTTSELKDKQNDCRQHLLAEIAHHKEFLVAVHNAQVESKKDADIKHEAVITTLAGLEATIHERIK